MSKETIAVDIDEVLYPFVDAFAAHHNDLYGTSVTKSDFYTYSFEGPLGLTIEDVVQRVYEFHAIDDLHVEPLEEAVDAIGRLAGRYSLELVTARHPQFEQQTLRWINSKFEGRFNGLTLIGYAPVMETPITKAMVCQEMGALALVDDSIGHVTECAEAGIEGILLGDYPWNQAERLPQGVTRLPNLTAVAEYYGV